MSSESLERASLENALAKLRSRPLGGVPLLHDTEADALLAEVTRLEQELSLLDRNATVWHADECGVHNENPPWRCTCDGNVLRDELAVAREREQRAIEALRHAEAFTREAYDYGCAWPIGLDTDPQEQRGQARDTFIRNAEFVGGIVRAALVDEPAAATEPPYVCPRGHRHRTGAAFCGVCGAGPVLPAPRVPYFGGGILGPPIGPQPAAATLAEPGRSRRDPPAVVDGEASLPGSASAAADEPGETP